MDMEEMNSAGSRVAFFLAGVGIGALIGILFAPQSGQQTREYISRKAEQGRDFAARKARQIRGRAEDWIGRGREMVERQRENISQAVDAGRQAYHGEMANPH